MYQDQLVDISKQGGIEWSAHALRRMLEQGISRATVKNIICTGELIEDFPDDTPFPSGLFFGIWQNQPLHVVIAYDRPNQNVFLITAYLPDEEHFEVDFKTRRKQ
jgi:hypothetical protein